MKKWEMTAEMTANENTDGISLIRRMPVVLRARGFRLYTQDNRRLIDLWLNGGAAVMGHTPPNMLRELKNTASRGLYAPFPHFTEGRFLKALSKLLPERIFRLYAAPPEESAILFNTGDAKFWRPFSDPASPKNTPFFVPVLSGIQLWRHNLPFGLFVIAAESKDRLAQLPESDTLPPVLLAVAARGIHDILASPQRAKPSLPRTSKALQKNTLWRRNGIYLNLKEEPDAKTWGTLFHRFLDAGFLLPPTPFQPLILPGELSPGEDAKLAAVLST